MMERHIYVPGLPRPQGSKRHVGNGRMIESSLHLDAWRKTVAAAVVADRWHDHPLVDVPVEVVLRFHLPRPKSHFVNKDRARPVKPGVPMWHLQLPDADKLARSVLDAITNAGAWRDDSQVVHLEASKVWAIFPGVAITVIEAR